MSETLLTAADNIRLGLLRDDDPANPAVDQLEMYQTIISQAQELGQRVGLGMAWASGAFTLTPNSIADYALPAVFYHSVIAMRIAVTGQLLFKVSREDVDLMREGITSTTTGGGDPRFFALWPGPDQLVTVRIDTVPNAARSIDVLRSLQPTTAYTDSATLPFDESFLRVLEKAVAAELASKLPVEELVRIKLNDRVVARWDADVERGVRLEQERIARLKRAPYGIGAVVS